MPFRVFVDANVLVPGRWRDIVLTLAEAELFEIRWSPLVLEESIDIFPPVWTPQPAPSCSRL